MMGVELRGRAAGRRAAIGALLLAGTAAACTPMLPPPDSSPRERFDWSRQRFDEGKWAAAIRGLRDHLFRDPLDATADSARLLLAESYLESGQELLAANEFQQLATTRPNGPFADDAQFGTCRSYWTLSPDVPRDQEFTQKTLEECTRLVEYHPRSPHVPEAQFLIAEARRKLAAKNLRVGRYYFDRGLHESAIIYFETLLREYPETPVVPQALGLLRQSYEIRGFRREAEAIRQRLIEAFPDSREARALTGPGVGG
jgi:outer membrane protein assembly factor BamD